MTTYLIEAKDRETKKTLWKILTALGYAQEHKRPMKSWLDCNLSATHVQITPNKKTFVATINYSGKKSLKMDQLPKLLFGKPDHVEIDFGCGKAEIRKTGVSFYNCCGDIMLSPAEMNKVVKAWNEMRKQ